MTKRFFAFAATFVALFVLVCAFLALVDMLPETAVASEGKEISEMVGQAVSEENSVSPQLPSRIVAKKIGLDRPVLNPMTTDYEELDEQLLKGTVRYPNSAMLGVEGTVLIFGHSSYLPIVSNSNFKAFNGIQKLKAGDTVSVYSGTIEYRYTVTGVRLANANEDVVELPQTGKHLVLVTCDSFGTKSDRFVVTADFVGVYGS